MTHTTENSKEVLAEEIANKWALDDGDLLHDAAIEAMKEFASLQNRKLLDSNRELINCLSNLIAEYHFISGDMTIPDIKNAEAAIDNAQNIMP
jgi:hypothetical protein